MNLRGVDLNLLVILDSVLTERSVTRAARRLNLTQPAVSLALARGRALFDDALLIRDGAGLTPTPRAQDLAPRLAEALAGIGAVLAPSLFDPATATRDFTLVTTDLAELVILPPVIAGAARSGPRCRLLIRSVEALPLADAGPAVDLAIMGTDPPPGPWRSRTLYEEHFVVLARPDHPALDGLTAEVFASLPHALVSPRGSGLTGPIDVALGALGLARRVALSVTRFTTLPGILAETDLIAAVPARFAARPEVRAICGCRPLPFASPCFPMRLVWHCAQDHSPAHVWLRSLF